MSSRPPSVEATPLSATNPEIKRVLIYRLGSLGDTLIALPALRLIARAFPNAERLMLTNLPVSSKAPAAGTVLAGTGIVHGYITYQAGMRSVVDLVSLWWKLVRWRPQVVVYMAAFRGAASVARDARFFKLCGVRHCIGLPLTESMQKCQRVTENDLLFQSEAQRLADNLVELGDARLNDPASWALQLTTEEIRRGRESLTPVSGRKFIAVCLGTKMQVKDWGHENWSNLLGVLGAKYLNHALVLCGAAEEAALSEAAAASWRTAAGSRATVLNLCGQPPRETAVVFREAQVFIGHDSGPMHLAAAVETPCVAIFPARNPPGVWFPHGQQHRVLYHQVNCWGCGLTACTVEKKKCILSITVDEVTAAVASILD